MRKLKPLYVWHYTQGYNEENCKNNEGNQLWELQSLINQ
jgi:hypothetical protein